MYVFSFLFLWSSSCTYTNLPKNPNSNLGLFHPFFYPLPFISPPGGLMWLDILTYACLQQKFLFILTSFNNLILAITLQCSWKFKMNYVQREVALFFIPRFPKFLLCCFWQFWIENFSTGSSDLCFSPSALIQFSSSHKNNPVISVLIIWRYWLTMSWWTCHKFTKAAFTCYIFRFV